MAFKALPSIEILNQLVWYEPEDGLLFWLPRTPEMFEPSPRRTQDHKAANWNANNAWKEAFGNMEPNGYKAGNIKGSRFYAHRIIWKIVYGADPEFIDHINGVRTDNRIENLRSVTKAENGRNCRPSPKASFPMGVRPSVTAGKWCASISVGNKSVHLGTFPGLDAAVAARKAAEEKYGFHPNHGA